MTRVSYRSSYESLVDDADYQALSPLAQAVFHTLKLKLGMYGIAVFYTGMLEAIHSKADPRVVHLALEELEGTKPVSGAAGWIRRERNVIWLVNGLKFDPAFTAGNTNNRKGAIAYAQSLPRLAIVDEFLSYYGLITPSHTPSTETPTPSPTPSPSTETETETEPETESGKRSQKGESESTIAVDNPPTTPADCPPSAHADSNDEQPTPQEQARAAVLMSFGVRRFLDQFYPASNAKRRADVESQLIASLTSIGTVIRRGEGVAMAYDLSHLEQCCALVKADTLREPDKAIHVLLVKLRDTWAETRALREKPEEHQRGRSAPAGGPTSISALLEQQRRTANV